MFILLIALLVVGERQPLKNRIFTAVLTLLLFGILVYPSIRAVKSTSKTITVPDDYQMIQEAIDNANEGDTVFVRSGTYSESLIIDKPISLIGQDNNITIIDGNGASKVLYVTGDHVTIEGFTVQNGGFPYYQSNAAIFLESSGNVISNNVIANNKDYAIWLNWSSNDNYVAYNVITSNWRGCLLRDNNNNSVVGNEIANNSEEGISLVGSSNNSVTGNKISNNGEGIILSDDDRHPSSNNSLIGNSLTENINGIGIYASPSNTMKNNTSNNNYENLGVSAYMYADNQISYFMQDIDESNKIDGKPILYLVNHYDEQIESDVSFVALVNCTNMTAKNLQLQSNSQGIIIAGTENSTFQNLNVTYNYYGIYLFKSHNNTFQGCNVVGGQVGIALENSWYNTIDHNNVTNTYGEGIILTYSSWNDITNNNLLSNRYRGVLVGLGLENTIAYNTARNNGMAGIGISSDGTPQHNRVHHNNLVNNTCGVQLGDTSSNLIYNNNFVDNERQAWLIDCPIGNVWDNGYPSGGNYWSDYSGTDTNNDGIGDTPYIIDANNQDAYPLIHRATTKQTDLNGDGVVNIVDITIAARAFGTKAGDPNWNSTADLDQNGIINIIDIAFVAKDYGKAV